METDLRFLTETYSPDKVVCREEQLKTILHSIDVYHSFGKGYNLLLCGRTGTGKTATLNHLRKQSVFLQYITCSIDNSPSKLLARLIGLDNYRRSDNLIYKLLDKLNKEPRGIIIDEIDKVRDLPRVLEILNIIYREKQVPIIIATKNFKFIKLLPEDIKLTLFLKPIFFNLYNMSELKTILEERLRLANISLLSNQIILICAIASNIGSARLLLHLAYKCITENNFKAGFMREIVKEFETQETSEFLVNQINNSDKKILKAIFELNTQNQLIDSKVLIEKSNLSSSTVAFALDHLEFLGMINTETKNLGGRLGKNRSVRIEKYEIEMIKRIKDVLLQ